mgnify:CR=1 FL=1
MRRRGRVARVLYARYQLYQPAWEGMKDSLHSWPATVSLDLDSTNRYPALGNSKLGHYCSKVRSEERIDPFSYSLSAAKHFASWCIAILGLASSIR